MISSLSRRSLFAGGGTAASALVAPAIARADGGPGRSSATSARFTLHAKVLDGGQQVVALSLVSPSLGRVRRDSAGPWNFGVHVTATNPLTGDVAYAQDRRVTDAVWEGDRLRLDLEHGEGVTGGQTLQYLLPYGRNIVLDLDYTITQLRPLVQKGASGREVWISSFDQRQGVSDPEVDAFSRHESASGMRYRLFVPEEEVHHDGAPLIVWLHGGGEGAIRRDGVDYYDNESHLRANRGALGFATPEAQELLDRAVVVAPQSFSAWMRDGDRFAPLIREIIQEVSAAQRIDPTRIHVIGCSNGGYMSLKMVAEYGAELASSVPICCGIGARDGSDDYFLSDEELEAMSTPTWLIHSRDDATLDAIENSVHAHERIEDSILSLYEEVVWDGHPFDGHFSWIYAAQNDPEHQGESLWQWMGRQRL